MTPKRIFRLVIMAVSVLPWSAFAQSGGGFEMMPSTAAAGGGVSTGGGFELGVTIGHPHAGPLTGGSFLLFSGFWAPPSAATDPRMSYWVFNLDGHYGHSPDDTINDRVSTIFADVYPAVVRYTGTDVYLRATGIPTYEVGPFPDGNPNVPEAQNRLFRIPRFPQRDFTPTPTNLGAIGVWVNGVAVFNPKDGNSFNGLNHWNQNAVVVEADGFDSALGHPEMGGIYHHHQHPVALLAQLGDTPDVHSPLIGFAFDGYPIYGPHASEFPLNGRSPIVRMRSGYRLRTDLTTRRNRRTDGSLIMGCNMSPPPQECGPDVCNDAGTPIACSSPSARYCPIDEPCLGYYIEDWEYRPDPGVLPAELDEYNGRNCVTPEFPGGTYAYFSTIDADGASAYPYAVGPQYYGVVAADTVNETVFLPVGASTFTATSTIPCASIWSQPASDTAHLGFAAVFTISVRYGPHAAFSWRKDALPLSDDDRIGGAATATLTLSDVTLADAGSYDCVVTDECGDLTSSPANLSVSVFGDGDLDGDVDLFDVPFLTACMLGPPIALGDGCGPFDVDDDDDVDLFDFAEFQIAFGRSTAVTSRRNR